MLHILPKKADFSQSSKAPKPRCPGVDRAARVPQISVLKWGIPWYTPKILQILGENHDQPSTLVEFFPNIFRPTHSHLHLQKSIFWPWESIEVSTARSWPIRRVATGRPGSPAWTAGRPPCGRHHGRRPCPVDDGFRVTHGSCMDHLGGSIVMGVPQDRWFISWKIQ